MAEVVVHGVFTIMYRVCALLCTGCVYYYVHGVCTIMYRVYALLCAWCICYYVQGMCTIMYRRCVNIMYRGVCTILCTGYVYSIVHRIYHMHGLRRVI